MQPTTMLLQPTKAVIIVYFPQNLNNTVEDKLQCSRTCRLLFKKNRLKARLPFKRMQRTQCKRLRCVRCMKNRIDYIVA